MGEFALVQVLRECLCDARVDLRDANGDFTLTEDNLVVLDQCQHKEQVCFTEGMGQFAVDIKD